MWAIPEIYRGRAFVCNVLEPVARWRQRVVLNSFYTRKSWMPAGWLMNSICCCMTAVVTGSYFCAVSATVDYHHREQDATAAEGHCACSTRYSGEWRRAARVVAFQPPRINAHVIHESGVSRSGFTGVWSLVRFTATADCPWSERVQLDLWTGSVFYLWHLF